jgi:DNA-binding NarL/FixJ family response regulator
MSTIRILLVHDRDYAIESLSRLIQFEKDMEVVGRARTGAEAIQLVKDLGPYVVLMDVTLPDMTGFEATHVVKTMTWPSRLCYWPMSSASRHSRRA